MSNPLPSSVQKDLLHRWLAEPTRFVFLPASTFVPNTRGYPVLPKQTQNFIRELTKVCHSIQYLVTLLIQRLKLNPMIILSSTQSNIHKTGGDLAYPQYIRHLEKTANSAQSLKEAPDQDSFTQGYHDYLQAPLQVSRFLVFSNQPLFSNTS